MPPDPYPQKERGEGRTGEWKKSVKILHYKNYTIIVESIADKKKQSEAKISHHANTTNLLLEKYVLHIVR